MAGGLRPIPTVHRIAEDQPDGCPIAPSAIANQPAEKATKMKQSLIGSIALVAVLASPASYAAPNPSRFESDGADRKAIMTLLHNYTIAVSAKDQVLFETLLLNKTIPFSSVASAVRSAGAEGGTQNYDSFRKGVFLGPPFTQRFEDVQIRQDGALADVSLVFVNTSRETSSWGWKTLQLIKVGKSWKIASELYTNHSS
ncbi:hypothetical protein [Lichenicola cladoniae]|nr:hypothetical protein [Lichenicola cladoniae]